MYLEHIEFDNQPFSIGDPLNQALRTKRIRFDPQLNLFVGPNASGKSCLLEMIASLGGAVAKTDRARRLNLYYSSIERMMINYAVKLSSDWPPPDREGRITLAGPVVSIPSARTATRTNAAWSTVPQMPATEHLKLLAKVPAKDLLEHALDTTNGVFRAEYVEMARWKFIESLPENLDELTIEENIETNVFVQGMIKAHQCAQEICAEVIMQKSQLTDRAEEPSDPKTNGTLGKILTTDRGISLPGISLPGFPEEDEENPNRTVREIEQLSSGTWTTLSWITALALKMSIHHGPEPGWDSRPAILVIDEIENQLHPAWQRRVIPALLKHFPGLQIFASTHSPFVAAGLDCGQIHQLGRNSKGEISFQTRDHDTFGWSPERIATEMFEVKNPASESDDRAAEALRELRRNGPDPDERTEEQRQTKMNELRKTLSRSVLENPGKPLESLETRIPEN